MGLGGLGVCFSGGGEHCKEDRKLKTDDLKRARGEMSSETLTREMAVNPMTCSSVFDQFSRLLLRKDDYPMPWQEVVR